MPIIAVPVATVEVQSTETASVSPENRAVKNADSETAKNIDDMFTCTSVSDADALIKEQTDMILYQSLFATQAATRQIDRQTDRHKK